MKRSVLFFSLVCLLFGNTASAQYGSGADGSINDGSGITYTDAIRTYLTANASSGQAVITVNDASAFSNGDLCLAIQMLGTGAGRYEEVTISSKTATTITFTTNLIYGYNANGSTNLAQVIRVPQYLNVTLKTAGDEITCNAWDGSTGGVCYFMVSGTLDFDADGKIHADAKGYRGGAGGTGVLGSTGGCAGMRGTIGNAGCAGSGGGSGGISCSCTGGFLGNGGAGGNAVGSADGGAGGGQDYSINAPSISYGNQGSDGEGLGAGKYNGVTLVYDAATNNSIMNNWGTSSGTDLLMGGGGAGGRQGVVSGGGGGGGGGAGGSSANGNSGTPGPAGNAGSVGGIGGTGGGIVRVKANTIMGTGLFQSNGTNGADGVTGSVGANGGAGGNRGIVGNAGSGGGGAGGLGGRGSCPGHGGAGGIVHVTHGTSSFTGSYVSVGGSRGSHSSGGTGGNGGAGGSSATAGTGGPGGQGGYSSDGCTGSAGAAGSGTTGGAGGAGAAPAPAGGCTASETYCNSISGSSGVVLPVELLSFTGFPRGKINILRWVTVTETNNDHFTLYRSEDLENWIKLSDVDGAGTSHTPNTYEFTDEKPVDNKINYYQLHQTDFDGKKSQSNIIAIVPDGKSSIYIAENKINVVISTPSNVEYEIIDVAGHVIEKAQLLELQQGLYTINISSLASSVYLLRMKVGNRTENVKFFKK